MEILQRTILKVAPGKMAEYMEVEKKSMDLANRYGMPPWKRHSCLSGDSVHTLIYDTEWDSLAAMEASYEKMFADPECQALMAKSDATVVSHENQFLKPMP